MTDTVATLANPYIGPRPFETGERLFGRERELRDLLHLLIAERVVLLYSPSGAGKSSLIQAGLIPALARKDFIALPSIRVNRTLPPTAPPEANRYVYSTLLSLEEHLPPAERLSPDELAALHLPHYLQHRLLPPIRAAEHDPILIFDQFEEVLTAELADLAAKRHFFEQLGQALADRQLWALFAMREDYLAPLEPYLAPIPNRLRDRLRLDLLHAEATHQAIQGPARLAGAMFAPNAAERLADELRRTYVRRPDGSTELALGPYVEPVRLQVVCLRLWEHLFGHPGQPAPEITLDDITDVADTDSALADFYADRLRAVAVATKIGERAIRDWVDWRLITPQGQRAQVRCEAGQSAGLDNRVIVSLIDACLVQADERHGIIWYELAHDCLVAPIRRSNAEWREAVLTTFQRRALLWQDQDRSDSLLLQGRELAKSERWALANVAELTENEQAFLHACRSARASRRFRLLLIGAVIAVVIAVVLGSQGRRAERQRLHQ